MKNTHFGFQTVEQSDKAGLVGQVFKSVAPRYDIMNDLMSGGLHRCWKNSFIEQLNPSPNTHLLDMAGGTGDIAFRFLKRVPDAQVTIGDINPAMLREGQSRQIDQSIKGHITWIEADAQSLQLPDNSVDYYTIAFGIRNVTDISKALREALRVLKPGGRFMCLEFSHLASPLLQQCYDAYSFHVIPKLGELITNDKEAYQYLVESIRMFPNATDFEQLIKDAGFSMVTHRLLTFGVVAIHSGWKI